MKCGISSIQKNKLWIIKAVNRRTRKTIAWVLGGRDSTTFRRLYNKIKHIPDCIYYTDNWDAFADVLPEERHIIGKTGTVTIERDNSNTRHNLGRFTRKTKVVSKSDQMVNLTIRLWHYLRKSKVFMVFQSIALSIYK